MAKKKGKKKATRKSPQRRSKLFPPGTMDTVGGAAAGLIVPRLVSNMIPIAQLQTPMGNAAARAGVGIAGAMVLRKYNRNAAMAFAGTAIADALISVLRNQGMFPGALGVSGFTSGSSMAAMGGRRMNYALPQNGAVSGFSSGRSPIADTSNYAGAGMYGG